MSDADALVALLDDQGIRYVRATSGPSGGQHVLVTFERPAPPAAVADVARQLRAHLPSLDITPLLNPRTGCIRPPGAPHRRGGASALCGVTVDQALARLRDANAPDAFARLRDVTSSRVGAPTMLGRTSRLTSALLRDGATGDGPGADGSRAAARLATSYLSRGFSYEQFRADLLRADGIGADAYRRRASRLGSDRAERWLRERVWARQAAWVALHPPCSVPGAVAARLQSMLDAAIASPVDDRGAATTTCVHLAVIQIASRAGRSVVDASQRDIADTAGVTRTTVARHLPRLVRERRIRRVARGRGEYAHTYELLPPDRWLHAANSETVNGGPHDPTPPARVGRGPRLTVGALGLDVWRYGGSLGKSGMLVYAVLDPAVPLRVRDIAAWLPALPERTIRRALSHLTHFELAQRDDRGRWLPRERDFDEVATSAGTAGIGARQRLRHSLERAGWRAWLARHRRRDDDVPCFAVDPDSGELVALMPVSSQSGWAHAPPRVDAA
jgi:hypothetical protein